MTILDTRVDASTAAVARPGPLRAALRCAAKVLLAVLASLLYAHLMS